MLRRLFAHLNVGHVLTARLLFVEELHAERFIALLRLAIVIIFGLGYFLTAWPFNSDAANTVFLIIILIQVINGILPNIEAFFSKATLLSTITIDALSVLALFYVVALEKSFKSAVNDEVLVYLQIMFLAFQAVRLSRLFIVYSAALLLVGRFLIYFYFRFVVEAGVSYEGSATSAIIRYVAIAVLLFIFTYAANRAKGLAARALNEYLEKNDLLIRNKELNELATVDELTGLSNHRHFHEQLQKHLGQARVDKSNLSLALIDLDNFKQANDQFGHKVGDEILQTVAELLRQHSEENDVTARYGGDELCVVLPGKNRYQAKEQLETLRQAVENTFKEKEKITLSIGIVQASNRRRFNANKMVLYADRAMYRAKRRGKNQIQLFS